MRYENRRHEKGSEQGERTMGTEWYLIAGLGNPERKYNGTRHNVGFETADLIIGRYRIDGPVRFKRSLIGKGRIGDAQVIVEKPMTYMNLSGEAIRECVDYYGIDPETHLIVLVDDIDLPPGHLRIRERGSAGGHNGLKNIVQHLGSGNFIRVRIGVGAKPDPSSDLVNHVLGHPVGEEREQIRAAMERAAEATACIITDGVQRAMSRYNG